MAHEPAKQHGSPVPPLNLKKAEEDKKVDPAVADCLKFANVSPRKIEGGVAPYVAPESPKHVDPTVAFMNRLKSPRNVTPAKPKEETEPVAQEEAKPTGAVDPTLAYINKLASRPRSRSSSAEKADLPKPEAQPDQPKAEPVDPALADFNKFAKRPRAPSLEKKVAPPEVQEPEDLSNVDGNPSAADLIGLIFETKQPSTPRNVEVETASQPAQQQPAQQQQQQQQEVQKQEDPTLSDMAKYIKPRTPRAQNAPEALQGAPAKTTNEPTVKSPRGVPTPSAQPLSPRAPTQPVAEPAQKPAPVASAPTSTPAPAETAPAAASMIFCGSCGTKNPEARFCFSCGSQLYNPKATSAVPTQASQPEQSAQQTQPQQPLSPRAQEADSSSDEATPASDPTLAYLARRQAKFDAARASKQS